MSWAKLIGGVVGAAVGGPVGAGIGVLLGAGFENGGHEATAMDAADGIPERAGPLALQQNGNALEVAEEIPADLPATIAVIRVGLAGQPLKSFVEEFQDTDQNFVLGRAIRGRTLFVHLPMHTVSILRNANHEVAVMVALFRDEEYLGYLSEVTTVRIGFEPWSVVRWLNPAVDLLAHYATRYGPWTGPKVQAIKAVFAECVELTGEEAEALRDRLKLATL